MESEKNKLYVSSYDSYKALCLDEFTADVNTTDKNTLIFIRDSTIDESKIDFSKFSIKINGNSTYYANKKGIIDEVKPYDSIEISYDNSFLQSSTYRKTVIGIDVKYIARFGNCFDNDSWYLQDSFRIKRKKLLSLDKDIIPFIYKLKR